MSVELAGFLKKYENEDFEKSSKETPQKFAKFTAELKKAMESDLGLSSLELASFSKGHFHVTGFLEHAGKYVYFSVGDVRLDGQLHWRNVLYRTARDTSDFSGGQNHFCPLYELIENAEVLLDAVA